MRISDESSVVVAVRACARDLGAQVERVTEKRRTPVEFAAGHLAGARNVPIHRLKQALPSLALNPERPIIAICATAHRSAPAVRLLYAAGYENARQLKGGMISWYVARLPTSKQTTTKGS